MIIKRIGKRIRKIRTDTELLRRSYLAGKTSTNEVLAKMAVLNEKLEDEERILKNRIFQLCGIDVYKILVE
jgi:hypothetical protein